MSKIPFLPIEELTPTFIIGALSETEDWGLMMVGVPEAHKHTKGKGIRVAILDTGGPNHIDINTNLETAYNTSDSTDVNDHVGHATHCAGIVAALENGIGVIGVAPESKIVPIKVLDDNGHSEYNTIEKGIRKAIELKVDIVSMSLGCPQPAPESLHTAIKEASAQGIIIFAAAGNDAGAVNWPARYDEVIAVAAIDNNGNLAAFSSRGDQIAVDAPGVSIYSTYLNNQYALLSGTSEACPFVAGVGALLMSWSRNTPGVNPISNTQEMLQRLDDLCDHQGRVGAHGKFGNLGYGIPKFANFMPWKE